MRLSERTDRQMSPCAVHVPDEAARSSPLPASDILPLAALSPIVVLLRCVRQNESLTPVRRQQQRRAAPATRSTAQVTRSRTPAHFSNHSVTLIVTRHSFSSVRSRADPFVSAMFSAFARSAISFRLRDDTPCAISPQNRLFSSISVSSSCGRGNTLLRVHTQVSMHRRETRQLIGSSSELAGRLTRALWTRTFLKPLGRVCLVAFADPYPMPGMRIWPLNRRLTLLSIPFGLRHDS